MWVSNEELGLRLPRPSVPFVSASVGIAPLTRNLDNLRGPLEPDVLSRLLNDARVTIDDLVNYIRFDPLRYTRNIVGEGPWYSLLVLCWRSGQRTTIHDHGESSCAFKVLTGICTETVFQFSPCGQVVPRQTREFLAGDVVTMAANEPHQVSNLQATGHDLVTLHVYTPPLRSLKTFSIMGDDLMTDWIGAGGVWLPDETKAAQLSRAPCLTDVQFEKVVRFMHANLKHDIHVIDLAKQTGHTPAHFSVLFRRRTGSSPYQFLKELRMRKAHRMIVAGEYDMKRLAVAVGFMNAGHFGEAFQKFWGYSVRHLRARVDSNAAKRRI